MQPTPQRFDFENDEVEGVLVGPDGLRVPGVTPIQHPSLIEIRASFVPEMLKTLESLGCGNSFS